jgi:dTDP-4-amino-4,6-dideoxygalactose transaminase
MSIDYLNRPPRKEFLTFGQPFIEDEDMQEVMDTLKSGWIGTGPKVSRFEKAFADLVGSPYAVAVNSCTAALHLALVIAGIEEGDEVITSPLTFPSTANVIIHVGAKPVFVDVELETQNLDPEKLEDAVTSKTRAIIPVHVAGRPCRLDAIQDVCGRHDLIILEDAAHAISAKYKGKNAGTVGEMGAFSFYATKELVTGEGGMLVTSREDLAQEAGHLRLHGLSTDAWARYTETVSPSYEVIAPGYKYNMTDMQASLALNQIKRITPNLKRREEIWTMYDDAFSTLPVTVPSPPQPNTTHARHLYTLLVNIDSIDHTRNEIIERLREQNIGAGIHFVSLHNQAYYKKTFGFSREDFPNADYISERTISIPLFASMSDDDVHDVIAALYRILWTD